MISFSVAHPFLVNDSGLNSSVPHINVSVNSLCQDDEYTITVQFGIRASGSVGCEFQQNVTIMNGGRVDIPSDITLGPGHNTVIMRCSVMWLEV